MHTSPAAARSAPRDRHLRVFLSSTFRDMIRERDRRVTVIFPQLRRLCEARGVTWGEVGRGRPGFHDLPGEQPGALCPHRPAPLNGESGLARGRC